MSSSPDHLILGRAGEEAARQYLVAKGYSIRAMNVRLGKLELDIVAYDPAERMMVFVEVKTRTRASDAYPIQSAVHWRKRERLRKAVRRWVVANDYAGPGRIDIVCVQCQQVTEHLLNIGGEGV